MESWVKEEMRLNKEWDAEGASLHKLWMKNESGRVTSFLNSLEILEGVPLSYLVPKGDMLPPESLRFFYLDRNWTEAMKDGAMSIGRNCTGDRVHDVTLLRQMKAAVKRTDGEGIYTGFFLRSQLVSGWNNLVISCISESGQEIPIVQRKILGTEVLLVIAEGKMAKIEMTEPLETISFGVEQGAHGPQIEVDIPGCGKESQRVVPVPMRDAESRVLNVTALAEAIQKVMDDSGNPEEVIRAAGYAAQLTRRQKCAVIPADWR